MPTTLMGLTERARSLPQRDWIYLSLITLAVYLSYGLERRLSRDSAIYYYSSKQFAIGVPPIVSIFDLKTPLASFFGGMGLALAPETGYHELVVLRALYIPIGLLTILATYQLAIDIWGCRWTAWVASLSLLAIEPLLYVTLDGPKPKVLVVFFLVVTVLAVARSRWFTAGLLGSLALLSWQPGAIALLVAGVSALARREGAAAPVRVAVGGAIPLLAMSGYFVAVGAFQEFLDSALLAHLGSLEAGEPMGVNLDRMWNTGYWRMGLMFPPVVIGVLSFFGLGAGLLARRNVGYRRALGPSVLGFVLFFLFSLQDFQGVPDWLPMLPFACLGFARASAVVWMRAETHRAELGSALRVLTVAFCAVALLVAASNTKHGDYRDQEKDVHDMLGEFEAGNSVVFLGAAVPLAFSGLRNASPHLAVPRGVTAYMDATIPGGVAGWLDGLRTVDPAIIVVQQSEGGLPPEVSKWVQEGRVVHPFKKWSVWAKSP